MDNIDVAQADPCTSEQRRAYIKNLVSFGMRNPASCFRYLQLKEQSGREEPLLFFAHLKVQLGLNAHLLDEVDPLNPEAVLSFIDDIRSTSVLDQQDAS